MLGYTSDELIGLEASAIVAESEAPHIEPAIEAPNLQLYHCRFRERVGREIRDGNCLFEHQIATGP